MRHYLTALERGQSIEFFPLLLCIRPCFRPLTLYSIRSQVRSTHYFLFADLEANSEHVEEVDVWEAHSPLAMFEQLLLEAVKISYRTV